MSTIAQNQIHKQTDKQTWANKWPTTNFVGGGTKTTEEIESKTYMNGAMKITTELDVLWLTELVN